MSKDTRDIMPVAEESSGAQSMFAQHESYKALLAGTGARTREYGAKKSFYKGMSSSQVGTARVLKKLAFYGHSLTRRLASRMPRNSVTHRAERFSRATAAGLLFRAGKNLPTVSGFEGSADVNRYGVIGHNLRAIVEAARNPRKKGLGIVDLRRLHKQGGAHGTDLFVPASADAAARRSIESALFSLDSKACQAHLLARENAILGPDARKSSVAYKFVRAKVAYMFPSFRVSAQAVCVLAESVLAQLDHLRHLIHGGATLFSAAKHTNKVAKEMCLMHLSGAKAHVEESKSALKSAKKELTAARRAVKSAATSERKALVSVNKAGHALAGATTQGANKRALGHRKAAVSRAQKRLKDAQQRIRDAASRLDAAEKAVREHESVVKRPKRAAAPKRPKAQKAKTPQKHAQQRRRSTEAERLAEEARVLGMLLSSNRRPRRS